MKRLLPLLAVVGALIAVAVITAVAVGASSFGSEKSSHRETSGDGSVPAMCTKDHPDCNDRALGQDGTSGGPANACIKDNPDCNDTGFGGGGSENACIAPDVAADAAQECSDTVGSGSRCAADAAPECQSIDSPPVDGGGTSPGAGASTTYDITVPFDATVTDDDTKLANEIVLAFDQNASFLLQESFPPTGRATLTSSALDVCAAIESKLEGIPSVGDVTCSPSTPANPPCCKPDAPVNSTPVGEPGVNPSQPGSAPDSGPTSR